jgi:hypothetical protein
MAPFLYLHSPFNPLSSKTLSKNLSNGSRRYNLIKSLRLFATPVGLFNLG